MDTYFTIILIANALWFGAGFLFFSLRAKRAAMLIVARSDRKEPPFNVVVHAVKFLGGLNLAFCALSVMVLGAHAVFSTDQQKTLLAFIFSLAHGTQFYGNLPIALKEYKGQKPVWPVLKGTMFFIFLIDAVLFIANLVYGLAAFPR